MADLPTMTGAGGTVTLKGRTFLLGRLQAADWGQIQEWMKKKIKRPFQVVDEALRDLASLKESDPETWEICRKDLMLSAIQDTKSGAIASDKETVERVMNSIDGVGFMLWLCVRKCHPEVLLEELQKLFNEEDLVTIKQHLDVANNSQQGDEDIIYGNPTRPIGPAQNSNQK